MSNGKKKNVIAAKGNKISLSPVNIFENPYREATILRNMHIKRPNPINT